MNWHLPVHTGATMGCIHGKGALADCFMHGVGALKDYRRGVELAIESAAAGSMYGQCQLAIAHHEDVDSIAPRNDARAAVLFQLAAEQGEVHSLSWLANMHLDGLGVPRSRREALRLFTRAAAIGDQTGNRAITSFNSDED
jgi:TPR repeat protein